MQKTGLTNYSPFRVYAGLEKGITYRQGCIFRLTCSHRELTNDHVLTSAYVKIFRAVTRNAVNKSV